MMAYNMHGEIRLTVTMEASTPAEVVSENENQDNHATLLREQQSLNERRPFFIYIYINIHCEDIWIIFTN